MNDTMPSAPQTQDILAPVQLEGTTAVLRAWLKQTGDAVVKDEPVAELETDKVVVEVFAPRDGVLNAIALVDSPVPSNTVLGRVTWQTTNTVTETKTEAGQEAHAAQHPQTISQRQTTTEQHARRLSPAVRRLVAEHGIDPTQIQGTGRNARLTRQDIVNAIERQQGVQTSPTVVGTRTTIGHDEHASAVTSTPNTATPPASPAALSTHIPHSPMRRRIAQHMQQSLATAPHVTAVFEADMSAILRHRAQHKPLFAQQGVHLTLTAYFVSAATAAMRTVPELNSRWHDDYLAVYQDVNVGIGTALGEQGLIVPVIHQAQTLSLLGIATRLQALTQAARGGTLTPQDVQHGTFTMSNYGGSGALLAAPIILNQGQTGILGIGAVKKRVVVADIQGADGLYIRPMAYVSLTIDHRVLNGDQANAWLTRFVEEIEGWT